MSDPIDGQEDWEKTCPICGIRNATDINACVRCGTYLALTPIEARLYDWIRTHDTSNGASYFDLREWARREMVETTLDDILSSMLDKGCIYEPVIGKLKVV